MTVRRWTDTARKLRREMSLPEVLLWRDLRGGPVKFRRQHPVGDYVVDFYCAAVKLAVEIDGWAHSAGERPERDERRDAWLATRGIRVVRIVASEVLADPAQVAASLTTLVATILPARGEVARSAGGGLEQEADVLACPPPSACGCHLPASGEDHRPHEAAQGSMPCR